ncbi:zinc-binding dehydrogenase [Streptomyces sp. NPDC046862]|uniref:zinc-binding dehydrogenase n=1 Tax=Streptomyces sp. NPDC046862 TaxID=3154603 RepID=UPI0034521198
MSWSTTPRSWTGCMPWVWRLPSPRSRLEPRTPWAVRSRAQLASMLTKLLALTTEGRLDPMLSRTVSLDEVPSALVELSGRGVRGKIVYARG